MHPSHLDILWFNGVHEMFSKEILRGSDEEGVNRFQMITVWSSGGGGEAPKPANHCGEKKEMSVDF